MLVFRMDEQNFVEGERESLRIATGQGLKVDFDEFAPDAATFGLWHLHDGACLGEGTGLEDASGNGHDLTNHGAELSEDGYRFVRTDGDYMDAAFAGEPARSLVTLECWVRDWGIAPALNTIGRIIYYVSGSSHFTLYAQRNPNPNLSYIRAQMRIAGGAFRLATWQNAAADAVLASPLPWHIAGVLDAPMSLRLFVNGVQRAQVTTDINALPAGDWDFYLSEPWAYNLSAILDEVRFSAAARYAAAFAPHRLLATGTYVSPTFDAIRVQADWLDLVCDEDVPPGGAVTWDVRAADETDAFGRPQAIWQPYGGDPAALPDGRYFQWRAALASSADRLSSPTIASVEARASEAGYDLYRGSGCGPESINYAQAFARVGPAVREIQAEPLEAGTVHWFGIRPVDARVAESPITQSEARIELDASGAPVPDRPAGALAIGGQAMPLGAVRLTWRYRPGITGVVPQVFRIFGDGGGGMIDYGSPLGEVAYEMGRAAYAATVEGLASGVEHQLAVRAVARGEVWDEQPATTPVTPDADAPGEVAALEAEVVP
jgi:hypothetical protein